MNERLKALAEQVGKRFGFVWADRFHNGQVQIDALVELVRQDERDACAKVCEELSKANWTFCNFAEAIRARGNHEQD